MMQENDPQSFGDAEQGVSYQAQRGGGPHHTVAMVDSLRDTRPWVLFLSILGFLGAAIFLVVAAAMAIAVVATGETAAIFGGVFIGVFYGGFGVFYLFFSVLLFRYFRAIGQLLVNDDTEDMERALDTQRVFFKASGIAVVVSIGLVFLSMIGAVIFAIVLAASGSMG